MFDLGIIGAQGIVDGVEVFSAMTTLGDFVETFEAPARFWTAVDYESHWLAAASRLVSGSDRVGLLVEDPHPAADHYLWWKLWRADARVFAQNGRLFRSELGGAVDLSNRDRYVKPRRQVSDDGDRISDCQVALDDIVACIVRKQEPERNKRGSSDREQ
jgi:hypothetical protein